MLTEEQRTKRNNYMREYYHRKNLREIVVERKRRWRLDNPHKTAEHSRNQAVSRPEAKRLYGARTNRKLRREVFSAYGNKCACCGESVFEFLTIDHVKNDGNLHRRKLKESGVNFYRWLKANGFPQDDFQCLCYNCNCAKARFGMCPHKRLESVLVSRVI